MRLQEELEGSQGMLAAKQEGEALLKAELGQLLEEVAQLREEAAGLRERAADADAAQVWPPGGWRGWAAWGGGSSGAGPARCWVPPLPSAPDIGRAAPPMGFVRAWRGEGWGGSGYGWDGPDRGDEGPWAAGDREGGIPGPDHPAGGGTGMRRPGRGRQAIPGGGRSPCMSPGRRPHRSCRPPQGTLQRLQEELDGQQAMLSARSEGEALLKAEVVRLTEENGQLREELLEQRGLVMGLQERLAELAESGDVAAIAQVCAPATHPAPSSPSAGRSPRPPPPTCCILLLLQPLATDWIHHDGVPPTRFRP